MYADHSCWFLACGSLCILFLACVIQYWVPPILIRILAESWWPLSVVGVLQGSMLIIKQRLSQITVIHLPDCKFQFASNVLYRVSVGWFRGLLHPRDTLLLEKSHEHTGTMRRRQRVFEKCCLWNGRGILSECTHTTQQSLVLLRTIRISLLQLEMTPSRGRSHH